MTTDIDALFAQIDNLQSKMDNDKSDKKTTSPQEYKNIDMVFLNGEVGTYEIKLLLGSDGNISSPIDMITIKNGNSKVCTVPSKVQQPKNPSNLDDIKDCELRVLQKKIDDTKKRKDSWRWRAYKLNKILIKTGDIVEGNGTLKPHTVYIAYVDDKFLDPLLKTLKNSRKYYESELKSMFDPNEVKGGLLVTASQIKRTRTYNFQFVPQLSFEPTNIDEVFGDLSRMTTSNQGYFRTNYVNEDKYQKGVQFLKSVLVQSLDEPNPPVEDTTEVKSDDPVPDKEAELEEKLNNLDDSIPF